MSAPTNQSNGLRAEYDADHHILYIRLPEHPNTTGSVDYTAQHETNDCLLYDIGHDGKVIGIEVMLSGPIEVSSGDNGITRTSATVPARVFRDALGEGLS